MGINIHKISYFLPLKSTSNYHNEKNLYIYTWRRNSGWNLQMVAEVTEEDDRA